MKKQLLFLLLGSLLSYAQGGTEVYLLSLDSNATLENISQNPGYDNQPSFWDHNQLLYTATLDGQTDLVRYDITRRTKSWLTHTRHGSEYSPLRIPKTEEISAIRLDTTGLQRLYRYDTSGKTSLLFSPLKIGYHLWLSPTTLLCTVLVGDGMDLVLAREGESPITLQQKVGRSLHRIPHSALVSYMAVRDGKNWLYQYDLEKRESIPLLELPTGVQDVCWLPTGELLYGQGNQLFRWDPKGSKAPQAWKTLTGIHNISRLAVSPHADYLALVGEEKDK
ncbi:MAG: hypothetical protein ACPG8F_00310 [Flavobacteriaceae bacterium]